MNRTLRAPFRIEKLLTDNGKAFTDRFSRGGRRSPSGNHPVDRYCHQQGIEHRLIAPGRPQTNGMVERFNGRINDVLATRLYHSSEDLEVTFKRYNWLYNHQIPQWALNHQPPIQAMKQWQVDRPDLFHKKRLSIIRGLTLNHPEPDM